MRRINRNTETRRRLIVESSQTMSSNYRRVSAEESAGIFRNSLDYRAGNRTLSERLTDKLVAFLWVVTAVAVAYFSDFIKILFYSDRTNRVILYIAFTCLGVNAILMLYLTVYLPRVKGLTDSSAWSVYCPKVIPGMTLIGVISGILLVRGTWPVWGFLAPFILGVEGVARGIRFQHHVVLYREQGSLREL